MARTKTTSSKHPAKRATSGRKAVSARRSCVSLSSLQAPTSPARAPGKGMRQRPKQRGSRKGGTLRAAAVGVQPKKVRQMILDHFLKSWQSAPDRARLLCIDELREALEYVDGDDYGRQWTALEHLWLALNGIYLGPVTMGLILVSFGVYPGLATLRRIIETLIDECRSLASQEHANNA